MLLHVACAESHIPPALSAMYVGCVVPTLAKQQIMGMLGSKPVHVSFIDPSFIDRFPWFPSPIHGSGRPPSSM